MSNKIYPSMSLTDSSSKGIDWGQKISLITAFTGLLIMLIAAFGQLDGAGAPYLYTSLVLISLGIISYSYFTFRTKQAGIKNNGIWHSSLTSKGALAWIAGLIITAFYILLYWFPAFLGLGSDGISNSGLVSFFDPLSFALKDSPASQWFVYGVLYTMGILLFGIRFIWKYRHNRYQVLRTLSVMFFQFGFAFLIPEFMQKLNYPYYDMKHMWPLNYYFFDEYNIMALLGSGNLGLWMIILGVAMIFVISPILTYLYGKRWYCSWVCGCGGLAETVGDPFRHLSDKSLKAWKIERWMIHSVLLFSFLMTVAVIYSFLHNNPSGFWIDKSIFVIFLVVFLLVLIVGPSRFGNLFRGIEARAIRILKVFCSVVLLLVIASYFTSNYHAFFFDGYILRSTYGFLIGAAFSGVIGVGFYPLMGSRVWCRFGCPMAAILGIQQKLFSRFRITTNGGQCISCGNCSTYCEMGIDVRSYAQKGQDIVRASCVGCGICSAVCPRGVLKLENGTLDIFNKAADWRTTHVEKQDK